MRKKMAVRFIVKLGIIAGFMVLIFGALYAIDKNFVKDGMRSIINLMPISKQYRQPVNIMILGFDKDNIRSDVDMVASFNPVNHKFHVFQIPRDTRMKYSLEDRSKIQLIENINPSKIPSHSIKLTEAYSYGGLGLTKYSLEKILGLKINYYMKVRLEAFTYIVDAVGGVDMYVPQDMVYYDPTQNLEINLRKGYQHLDGAQSEEFVRFRHYAMGDINRIQAQKTFLKLLGKKVLSINGLLHYGLIKEKVTKYTENNLGSDAISAYGLQAIELEDKDIKFEAVPGSAPPASETGGISYFIYDPYKTKISVSNMLTWLGTNDAADNDFNSAQAIPVTKSSDDKASISIDVLNSTNVNGLAKSVAEKLKDQGYKINTVGNYSYYKYVHSRIVNYGGVSDKICEGISSTLKTGQIAKKEDIKLNNTNSDVVIIIGSDMTK